MPICAVSVGAIPLLLDCIASEIMRRVIEVSRLIDRIEGLIGLRCPHCGLKEWPSKYTDKEVRSWEEVSWWNRKCYRLIERKHLTCGTTWTEKLYATSVDGYED